MNMLRHGFPDLSNRVRDFFLLEPHKAQKGHKS